MIRNVIAGALGAKAAEQTKDIGGATGALLGMGAATLISRLSLPGLVAMTVGGYVLKRYLDKKDQDEPQAAPAANSAEKSTAKKKPAKRTKRAAD